MSDPPAFPVGANIEAVEPSKEDRFRLPTHSHSWPEETGDAAEAYSDLLREYVHVLLRLEFDNGELGEQLVLGLRNAARPEAPVYIELDDFDNPIPTTEDGFAAVQVADEIQAGVLANKSDLADHLVHIVEQSQSESIALRFGILQRLSKALRKYQAPLPTQLSWLAPWALMNEHLDSLARTLEGQSSRDVPRLAHYFRDIAPGLAPTLLRLQEETRSGEIQSGTVAHLCQALTSVSANHLPPDTRSRFEDLLPKLQQVPTLRNLDSVIHATLEHLGQTSQNRVPAVDEPAVSRHQGQFVSSVGRRLRAAVDRMLEGVEAVVVGARVVPVEVRRESPASGLVPARLELSSESPVLGQHVQTRALFLPGTIRLWIVGLTSLRGDEDVRVMAVTDAGELIVAAGVLEGHPPRLDVQMSWIDPAPPTEIAIVIIKEP